MYLTARIVLVAGLLTLAGCNSDGTAEPSGTTAEPSTTAANTPTSTETLAADTTAPIEDTVRHIDVGGYDLTIECHGTGAPTVVYLAGTDATKDALPAPPLVRTDLAATQRVCAYERAGVGTSDARPRTLPSTVAQGADELATLLDAAGETGPYVLLAYSMGGHFATAFADLHADLVAGVVLLDTDYTPELVPNTSTARDGASTIDLDGSKQPLIHARPMGTIPLVVVGDGTIGVTNSAHDWLDFNDHAMAVQSADSLLISAPAGGRDLFTETPELVLAAVAEVSAAATTGQPLRPCDDRFTAFDAECLASDTPAAAAPDALAGWWASDLVDAGQIQSFLDAQGLGDVAAGVGGNLGLPGVLTVGFGAGWFAAGTLDSPIVDFGSYEVQGDTIVLTTPGTTATRVLRWSIVDDALSFELVSDSLPDFDGIADVAYSSVLYDLPTFHPER